MIIGTAYFPTMYCAVRYYGSYADVEYKIEMGEIHIGKPPLEEGESLTLLDGGLRYGIQRPEPTE